MSGGKLRLCCIVFFLYLVSHLRVVASTIETTEYFDPFKELKLTAEGKEILELAKFADFDTLLAKKQLASLKKTGIGNKSLAHQVAISVAYIALYRVQGDLDKASQEVDELHLLAIKNDENWLLAKVFEQQAIIYFRKGNYKKAMKIANQAIIISQDINYSDTQAIATGLRAILHGKMGDHSKAIDDTLTALSYFNAREDNKRISILYSNLVTIYLYRLDYEKALLYSDKSLTILENLPQISQRRIAINYMNRAIALGNLGRDEEELDAFMKAEKLAIKINDTELISSVDANLSDYFLRNENYNSAAQKATECLKVTVITKNIDIESICLLNKGLAQVKLGQKQQGIDNISRAHTIIKDGGLNSSLVSVYQTFHEAYEHIGDYKQSMFWYKKYHDSSIEKIKKNDSSHQQSLESQYKNTVNRQEIEYKELKENMLGSVLSQESLIKYLWLAIFILSTIIIILLVYSRIKHKK